MILNEIYWGRIGRILAVAMFSSGGLVRHIGRGRGVIVHPYPGVNMTCQGVDQDIKLTDLVFSLPFHCYRLLYGIRARTSIETALKLSHPPFQYCAQQCIISARHYYQELSSEASAL